MPERLLVEQVRADEVEKGFRIFEPLLQTFVDVENVEGEDIEWRRWTADGWTSPYVRPDQLILRVVPSPPEPDEAAAIDQANAEASRYEDDRTEAREERDAAFAELERLIRFLPSHTLLDDARALLAKHGRSIWVES
jgi:hemin uptake protein HemP